MHTPLRTKYYKYKKMRLNKSIKLQENSKDGLFRERERGKKF